MSQSCCKCEYFTDLYVKRNEWLWQHFCCSKMVSFLLVVDHLPVHVPQLVSCTELQICATPLGFQSRVLQTPTSSSFVCLCCIIMFLWSCSVVALGLRFHFRCRTWLLRVCSRQWIFKTYQKVLSLSIAVSLLEIYITTSLTFFSCPSYPWQWYKVPVIKRRISLHLFHSLACAHPA